MPKTQMTEAEYQRLRRRERRLVLFALGLLLAVVGGGLVYLFFQPMYEASSWLQIEATAPYLAFPTEDDSRRFIATQEQLIRSPLVLGPVVSQLEIARLRDIEEQEDPVTWLGEQIEVRSVGESELFTVSFRSPEPANAARIVNSVMDAFFKLRSQQDAQRVQRVIELLEQEKERRASELARLRENVRELTKQATGRDPFAATPALEGDPLQTHPLAALQTRLTTAEVEQEILKAQIKAFEENVKLLEERIKASEKDSKASEEEITPTEGEAKASDKEIRTSEKDISPSEEEVSQQQLEVPDAMVEERIAQNTFVQELEKLLFQKRLKLFDAETTASATDGQPLISRLKEEIRKAEVKLAEVRNELVPRIRKEIEMALVNDRRWQLAQMQSELENHRFVQKALQERYDSQLAGLKQFSGETLELEFKRAELARAEEVHDLITARAVMLRTEQRAPSRINMLQSATVPTEPVSTPYKMVSMASLAGFCLPFVLVGLRAGIARVCAKPLKSRTRLATRVR